MRLIDADAALNALTEYWDRRCMPAVLDGETATYVDCKLIIKRQPTIDAVPVVRCRECKHSEPWYGDRSRCFLWVEDGISVFNDGFCSYGERKDGDGDE